MKWLDRRRLRLAAMRDAEYEQMSNLVRHLGQYLADTKHTVTVKHITEPVRPPQGGHIVVTDYTDGGRRAMGHPFTINENDRRITADVPRFTESGVVYDQVQIELDRYW